tara:strand:- start:27146 stop:28222 length:1077 start_codon:yes stop_codon:yes gene_type:complete
MASKKYAYYNKGNKIAIIEQYDSTSSGKLAVAHCTIGGHSTKDACEAAGGQWIPGSSGSIENLGKYQSPQVDVAKGLEIEYTYAPIYNPGSSHMAATLRSIMNGWYVDEDGYINLVRTNFDWDTLGAAAGYVADAWIYVDGANHLLQGIHQIKSVGTETYHGNIQLHTQWMENASLHVAATNMDFDTDETIAFNQAEDFAGMIGIGNYVYILGQESSSAVNTGLFKISATGTAEFTVSKYYEISNTSSVQEISPDDYEKESDATLADETISCKAYQAYRDPHFITVASVMEDETFELDLTRYQANAVVYYLQAKKFEDAGDIERYEYYMRQFKKQLEKSASSRKHGPYIAQGHWSMRK